MIPQPARAQEPIRFGDDFELDCSTRRLRRGSQKLKLERIPLEILILLLEHCGEVVTRDEIVAKVWGKGVFFDSDNSIRGAVRKIRQVLKDDPEYPRFIQTVTGQGYRFIARVIGPEEGKGAYLSTDDGAKESNAETPSLVESDRRQRLQRATRWLVAGVAAGLALLAGAYVAFRSHAAASGPKITSLVVLPLENLSGDPSQEYFADGMTEALITDLAQFSSLRVISRTSAMHYKGSHQPLPEIAEELNVDAVVEGSVTRSGNRVRITAQLLQARSDRHLWAKAYERDVREIITLQQDVADNIVSEIQPKLRPQESASVSREQQINPEAYDAYLQGMYFSQKFNQVGNRRALQYFEVSIRKDPSYALGYAGLSNVYSELAYYQRPVEVMPKAKEAAEAALKIDNTLANAHAALAWVKWVYDWDFASAEKEFQRAIQFNPGLTVGHGMYAIFLDSMGRFEESFREFQIARQLDPVSVGLIRNAAEHFRYMRQYDRAIAENLRALEMDPGFANAHESLAYAYANSGMYEESIREMEQLAIAEDEHDLAETMKLAYADGGYKAALNSRLKYYKDRRVAGVHVNYWDQALTHAQAGNKDLALAALEKAYDEREDLTDLAVNPSWDSIRNDPRFQGLVRRVGLPVNPDAGVTAP